ncbi:MAG TPA: hypothetical protein VEQ66_13610 [Propionibacteriaceae bacterium]|nr:hypothetical protein [Propionibacteriaceae bacterium]
MSQARTDLILTAAALALLLLAGLILAATGTTRQLLAWAWERHANVLSWYIRPLFLLPLAYFSYKRWISGIVVTLIALATGIAWFPAPEQVQPRIAEFLAFERAWLTFGWTPEKVLSWTLALTGLAAVCLAFCGAHWRGDWSSSPPSPSARWPGECLRERAPARPC